MEIVNNTSSNLYTLWGAVWISAFALGVASAVVTGENSHAVPILLLLNYTVHSLSHGKLSIQLCISLKCVNHLALIIFEPLATRYSQTQISTLITSDYGNPLHQLRINNPSIPCPTERRIDCCVILLWYGYSGAQFSCSSIPKELVDFL